MLFCIGYSVGPCRDHLTGGYVACQRLPKFRLTAKLDIFQERYTTWIAVSGGVNICII